LLAVAEQTAARSRTSSRTSPRNSGRDRRHHRDPEDGRIAHLELLLLPFNNRAHAPISLTGCLAPFEDDLGTCGISS